MKFISMREGIIQPFSTTTSYHVAVSFSGNIGMVLELDCNEWSRYFNCSWISDYPNEHEIFFINPFTFFQMTDIIDTTTGQHYDEYVKALSIINSVFQGNPFQINKDVMKESVRREYVMNTKFDLELLGAKPIDPRLKIITLQLMKHELHRYEPGKYKKMKNIDKYTEELLHFMCSKTSAVMINLNIMSVEIIDGYNKNGYNGYLFLKSLFFKKDLEIIDLEFIFLLLPNVRVVKLKNCTSIDYFDYILDVLTKIEQKEKYKSLCLLKLFFYEKSKVIINGIIDRYYTAFQNIGWLLKRDTEQRLVGKKIETGWIELVENDEWIAIARKSAIYK
eukprot:415400_1